MPKIRSNRSAAKRFRANGKGKVRRASGYARHQMSAKTTKQKRKLRGSRAVADADVRAVRRLLPYL